MNSAPLRQAELPGIRPLYADLLRNFPGVSRFYGRPPSIEAARAAVSEIRIEPAHRKLLVDELAAQNPDGGAATDANLDLLSRPGTAVVATGQQVGVLGGPVFTLYKALTAVRCAEELTAGGVPAVPVFWLATEDHDLDEVDHAWVFGPTAAPRKIQAVAQGTRGAAVGAIRVADAGIDELEAAWGGLPFAAEATQIARDAYGSSPGFGEGFRALYRRLLDRTGIIFLSPMSAGIRSLAAPLVRRAIERAPELSEALVRRGGGLQAAGYHQQVNFRDSASLVLLFEDSARVALKRKNGLYWANSRAYSREELLRRLEQAPLDVSPSALLRPVMQDYLLPTAALVAGPSEASYLAQSSVLYEDLLGRMPAVLPRASFTVLDATTRKLLGRYGLTLPECLVARRELESAIAERVVPQSLRASVEGHRSRIGKSLGKIGTDLSDFDPTLAASFEVSQRKIEYQLEKVAAKVSREALRRDATARRHAGLIADWIYPRGNLQERVYSVLPFVAKFGDGFVDRVQAAIRPGEDEHAVLDL